MPKKRPNGRVASLDIDVSVDLSNVARHVQNRARLGFSGRHIAPFCGTSAPKMTSRGQAIDRATGHPVYPADVTSAHASRVLAADDLSVQRRRMADCATTTSVRPFMPPIVQVPLDRGTSMPSFNEMAASHNLQKAWDPDLGRSRPTES